MRRTAFIIILLLLLIFVSSAKHESLTMGPYKVTFDLNTTEAYGINNSVRHGETYAGTEFTGYQIHIAGSYDIAEIGLPIMQKVWRSIQAPQLKTISAVEITLILDYMIEQSTEVLLL